MKQATCNFEGEYVHMKAKSQDFWLKLKGGPRRKRLENHQKSNLCLWRGICAHEGEKYRFLTKTDRGSLTKKAGKSPKKQLVIMKENTRTWKSKGFWLKLIGGSPTKKVGNHEKSNLCLWRGIWVHEGGKWGFLTKTDRGSPYEKGWKITKKRQLVFMKGNMCTWRRKQRVLSRFRCWCLELYHALIVDVLSSITFPLLMSWAVSRFRCWCFKLYHASVAEVLSCITFPALMFWAVSCFCCWCLELYHAFVVDVLSCVTLR